MIKAPTAGEADRRISPVKFSNVSNYMNPTLFLSTQKNVTAPSYTD